MIDRSVDRFSWPTRSHRESGLPLMVVSAAIIAATMVLSYTNAWSQSSEAALITVETINPERTTTDRTTRLVGHVEPWNQTILYAKVSGYLEWIGVDIGSWVKKGDVVARIDDPEMRSDLERLRADAKAKRAISDRLRAAQRDNPDMVSRLEVDRGEGEAEAAEAALTRTEHLVEYAQITAPYNGVITDRWVDPGALIQVATSSQSSSARIVRIMNFDTVRVTVSVPEPDCPSLRRDAGAVVTVSELPGQQFIGHIARFAWVIDPMSRTMEAEIDVPNPAHVLRPGMFAVVEISLEQPSRALRVPSETILIDGDKRFVWTVRDGQAYRVEITVREDDGVYTEISGGLMGSESIVRRGHQGLTEGASVQTQTVIQSSAN